MTDFLLEQEQTIRLSFFIGVFIVMAIWEIRRPRRALTQNKLHRWFNNIGLVICNTLLLRFIFPAAAVGMAFFAEQHGWGLFNVLSWPSWVIIPLTIIAFDFIIYLQHFLFHAVPVLWRLHRVHHADMDFDVTTGARFHPIEIILSMVIKYAAIVALGAPVVAVILFEIILSSMAMFNHSNIKLPSVIDRRLRFILVTPDMHRVHHSINTHEANSNFGFSLAIWDRYLGTYRAQPESGHEKMLLGIDYFQVQSIFGMLHLPFKGKSKD